MYLAQIFKTREGAGKRAHFENMHCNHKYVFKVWPCDENGNILDRKFMFETNYYRLEKVRRTIVA